MTVVKQRQIDKSYEIYLALYQGLSGNDETANMYKQFTSDFFDLIIIDDCHRGSAEEESAWREILKYFKNATLCDKLKAFCEKIDIAGSVRRKKPEVRDIEICCIPKMTSNNSIVLFGEVSVSYVLNSDFKNIITTLGSRIKGKPEGNYMQIELPEGVKLDLFMPNDYDYYRQLAIRTGSAGYSANIIAAGWRNIGWCGSDKGLRKISDCKQQKGGTWRCINDKAELPPVWESEEDFFNWIGVRMLEPNMRNI